MKDPLISCACTIVPNAATTFAACRAKASARSAGLSFALHPVFIISWLILGWAAIVGIWNVRQIRRLWQSQSDWIAFTKGGVWVKEPRAKALLLPWVAFVRVAVKPFEFAMKDGKKTWPMRLYRALEPEEVGTFPYRFGKRHTDLVFELRADDDEAKQIRGAIDAFLAESKSSLPDQTDAIAE